MRQTDEQERDGTGKLGADCLCRHPGSAVPRLPGATAQYQLHVCMLLFRSKKSHFPPDCFSAMQTNSWTRGTVWIPWLRQPVPLPAPGTAHWRLRADERSPQLDRVHSDKSLLMRCSPAPNLGAEIQGNGEWAQGTTLSSWLGNARKNCSYNPVQPLPGTWQGPEVRLEVAAHRCDHALTDLWARKAAKLSKGSSARGGLFTPPGQSLSRRLCFAARCQFYSLQKPA